VLEEGEGEVQDELELATIRGLHGTVLQVSQYGDNRIFSNIDSFVKLSEGIRL
jgi:hypothetical protein